MDGHSMNASYPYNSAGSFIEYFEGLTYDNGASHVQVSFIRVLCNYPVRIIYAFNNI
jgi:E3 ubiquitin-protein ligase BIG BROTHER-like protein